MGGKTSGGFYVQSSVPTNGALQTKNTNSTVRSGGSITATLPSADMDRVIPYLAGKRMVNGNLAYAGNPKALREKTIESNTEVTEVENEDGSVTTETVVTTVKTDTVVGITCDIQLLLCLGPNVSLRSILCGEEIIWTGNAGPARTQIGPLPNAGHGLSGATIWFSGGAFNQAPEPELASQVDDLPGYVGMAYVFIKGFRADKFTGSLAFEVFRLPDFGASPKDNSNGDINAAVLIGDIITNEWGGAGVSLDDIDLANDGRFDLAQEKLAEENNYGSIILTEKTTAVDVLSKLQQQVDGVVYQSPQTQLISLSLYRQTIRLADALSLGEQDIITLTSWEKTGWNDTIDLMRLSFPDRDNFYRDNPIPIPNGLVRGVKGRGRSVGSMALPYVPDLAIAYDIGHRFMRDYGIPTFGFSINTNRKAAYCYPGQVVTVSYPPEGLFGVRVNVVSCSRDVLDENKVTLLCRQSDFIDNADLKVPIDDIPRAPEQTVSATPKTPLLPFIMDTPFYFVRGRGLDVDPRDFASPHSYPLLLAAPADAAQQAYGVKLTNYPGTAEGEFEQTVVDRANYPSFGRLVSALDRFEAVATGIIPELRITRTVAADDDFVTEAQAANSGERFLIIRDQQDEIMTYESATIDGAEYVLENVHRGLIDTAPAAHAANTPVYIISNNFKNVSRKPIPMAGAFIPHWRFTGYNVQGAASPNSVETSGGYFPGFVRNSYAPRPHDARVDGVRQGAGYAVGASVDVTWKTRWRKAPGVTLWADAAERGDYVDAGPDYQIHQVMFVDSHGLVYQASESVTPAFNPANALTVTVPLMFNGPAFLYVRAVFQTHQSLYEDWIPIGDITGGISGGYGNDYGLSYGVLI